MIFQYIMLLCFQHNLREITQNHPNSRRDEIEKNYHFFFTFQNFKRVQFQRRKRDCGTKWPHIESNPCFRRANKFAHLTVRGVEGGKGGKGGEREGTRKSTS